MSINIASNLNVNLPVPDLDARYGPYATVEEAYKDVGPDGADVAVVGLTVGIKDETTGEIVEYWFSGGTALENLVAKQPKLETATTKEIESLFGETEDDATEESA